jgi:competence protein ComGF
METKQHFPGEYGYKDIIKFKRKGKIAEGMIVGITVSCIDTDNEFITYKVHSLDGAEDKFHFYEVRDSKIIKD